MNFLIDEDVPAQVTSSLAEMGHDCVRVRLASSDMENANRAKKEGRIFVTLDKDFTNISRYPPAQYNITRLQIHPPYADALITAFKKFLESTAPDDIKGLIILEKAGHIRFLA